MTPDAECYFLRLLERSGHQSVSLPSIPTFAMNGGGSRLFVRLIAGRAFTKIAAISCPVRSRLLLRTITRAPPSLIVRRTGPR